MTTLNISLDDNLHSQADQVFASYGLSPTQAIKLFFNQVVSTKAIPLSFDYHSSYNGIANDEFESNEETYQAVLAGREEYKSGQLKRYQFDNFMQSLAETSHAD